MFACIHIPDFPVEAMVRAEPLLRDRAVAALEGKPPLVRVIALNEKARLLGMEVGMTKLQAAVFVDPLPLQAAGKVRLLPRSGRAGLQARVQVLYSCHPEPTLVGEGSAVPTFSAACLENEKEPVPQCGNNGAATSPHSNLAVLRQRSPAQEISAHAALLDVAHAFTPRVEDTAPDTLLLDLEGLDRLYGPPARMAGDLAARITAVGMEANIAVAANPAAAMHAARGFNGTTIIPAGNEAQRLGVLPLQVLLDGFEISAHNKAGGQAPERAREKLREQMLDTLERWGVRDFRTLALLPEHALASRLGEAGTQLRRLARGEGMRTLMLCAPLSQFEEAMELESPVETIESLSFVLNRLLEQLCARLESRALAAHELRLRLQLERRVADEATTTPQELARSSPESLNATSGAEARAFRPATISATRKRFGPGEEVSKYNAALTPVFERTLRLPVSMRDAKVFLKLLQLELAAHPPGAPVNKIWITAEPAPPRSAQHRLFLPVTPEAEKLEITLARISAVVGERRAGIARLLDSHRQGSFRMDRFMVTANDIKQNSTSSKTGLSQVQEAHSPTGLLIGLCQGTAFSRAARPSRSQGFSPCGEALEQGQPGYKTASCPTTWDANDSPPLAMRLFRPACRLQVRLAEGRPDLLATEPKQKDREELQGKVAWSAGPWRSSGDWWTENARQDDSNAVQSGPWDREEWDIALVSSDNGANEGGNNVALYRIYRDLATGQWFADASYD
ncbi:MAG: hypothetical protein ABSD98_19535 [Candidatus Korobacteraceae bacterium]|jgi:protein ImuB